MACSSQLCHFITSFYITELWKFIRCSGENSWLDTHIKDISLRSWISFLFLKWHYSKHKVWFLFFCLDIHCYWRHPKVSSSLSPLLKIIWLHKFHFISRSSISTHYLLFNKFLNDYNCLLWLKKKKSFNFIFVLSLELKVLGILNTSCF